MPRLTNEEKAAIKEQFKQQKMAEKLALKEEMKKKKQEEMQKRREEKAIVNFFFSNFIIWYQRKMPWSSGHVLNKLVLVQFVALSKNCQLKQIQM